MSWLDDPRANRIAARFGRTVASTWSNRLNPGAARPAMPTSHLEASKPACPPAG